MKFCPQCGTTFEPEARFCLECGFDQASLEPSVTSAFPGPEATASQTPAVPVAPVGSYAPPNTKEGMSCPQCGNPISAHDRFCPECAFDTTTIRPQASEVSPPPDSRKAEEPPTPAGNKRFCPQCGTTVAPDDRFCPECGCDTNPGDSGSKTGFQPVDQPKTIYQGNQQPPVSAPPMPPRPAPKPAPVSPQPPPERTPSPAHSSATKAPAAQPKEKKSLIWVLLLVLAIGALGAAGWFGYTRYFKPSAEIPVDTVTSMAIPEPPAEEVPATTTEATEPEAAADPDLQKESGKPVSRIDQEIARQKAKQQNKAAQQQAPPAQKSKPSLGVKISPGAAASSQPLKVILEVGRKEDASKKNPKNPTKLSLSGPTMIVRITTDHYNGGMGTPRGGTITIKDKQGNTLGSYKAFGKTGKSGAPGAKWVVEPNILLEKGTYYIWDSDMATWSKNLLGFGFVEVEGYEVE